MEDIYIVTGSNMGDRRKLLNFARRELSDQGEVMEYSRIYETEPWGFSSANPFLNQVLKYHTRLGPEELMNFLLNIEKQAGRTRTPGKYEDRVLDLDILFYGNRIIHTDFLTIPHPKITERRFVLEPLSELAPQLKHPEKGSTVEQMLRKCKDETQVKALNPSD